MAADTASVAERKTARRAWITVAIGVCVFATLLVAVFLAASWALEHATAQKSATARVISGSEALWRRSANDEWSIFDSTITIHEGDEISTELGTVVWITAFDGSTLEITERTHVKFTRLRESRFSDSARQLQIELNRGSIYGALAPVVDYEYAEIEISTEDAAVVVRGDRQSSDSPSTSFVVEVPDDQPGASYNFRAAAFRGQVEVRAADEDVRLVGPEQVIIDDAGEVVVDARIQSEMIANGNFEDDLTGWDFTYSAEAREPQDRAGTIETVVLDDGNAATALRIHREDSSIWARTGISQTIDRTLRLPAALTLSFDVLIEHQGPPVSGRATVPLAVELDYTDILGQDRTWTTAYAERRDDGIVDANAFTTIIPGEWTKVIVELENLEPIPKILGTMVVYASGGGYSAQIANLSLTAGEGTTNP